MVLVGKYILVRVKNGIGKIVVYLIFFLEKCDREKLYI